MKGTRVTIPSDQQFDRLEEIRDKHGLTWRGLLIRGAERLESTSPFPRRDDRPDAVDGEEIRE